MLPEDAVDKPPVQIVSESVQVFVGHASYGSAVVPGRHELLLDDSRGPLSYHLCQALESALPAAHCLEAATLEAAQQVLSRRAQLATAQRIVDRGEAASLDEAQQLLARRRREAFEAKYSFEDIYKISSASGIKTAKKRGFRTRYPGVRWQKKQDKKTGKTLDEGTGSFPESSRGFWRVAFQYKGKPISVGSGYEDEEAAARAHDDYVRKHKLQRRLHFPRAGEGGGVGAEA